MLTDGEREGGPPLVLLAKLATVATESRLENPLDDAIDSLDARRERAAEINMRVSCSVMGEGPGTGGRGVDGGREGGGLMPADGVVINGEGGICDGGAGKDESRRGTASLAGLRRSRKRDCTVSVEVMTPDVVHFERVKIFSMSYAIEERHCSPEEKPKDQKSKGPC